MSQFSSPRKRRPNCLSDGAVSYITLVQFGRRFLGDENWDIGIEDLFCYTVHAIEHCTSENRIGPIACFDTAYKYVEKKLLELAKSGIWGKSGLAYDAADSKNRRELRWLKLLSHTAWCVTSFSQNLVTYGCWQWDEMWEMEIERILFVCRWTRDVWRKCIQIFERMLHNIFRECTCRTLAGLHHCTMRKPHDNNTGEKVPQLFDDCERQAFVGTGMKHKRARL